MFRCTRSRLSGASFFFACLVYALAARVSAAEPKWLKLQAPSFGVIMPPGRAAAAATP